MLLVNNLTKVYNELDADTRVVALKNVTLTLPDTGLVAIVGASGCGKTTLLNILGGIDQPSDGRVFCDGEEVDFSSSINLDVYRSFTTSLVFQEYNLLYDYNVLDNVKLGLQLQGKSKRETTNKAMDALKAVGLEQLAKRRIGTLSGGQQQRVAVARAIAKDSKIVLCDEPTGNLDSLNAAEVFTFIKQCAQSRLFVVVTHDEQLANQYADRVIRLADGSIVQDSVDDAQLRKVYAPDADELFAVDTRMSDTERIAKYIKRKFAQSSDYVKKRADHAFETMYDDTAFANSFKKNAVLARRDLGRTAKFIKNTAETSFSLLHIKGSSRFVAQTELEKFGIRVNFRSDDNKDDNKRPDKDKRVHGLTFSNVLRMIKNNILRSAIFNSVMLIAMVIALSLVTVFFSLQLYSGQSALVDTLSSNGDYIIPIVKYKDIPIQKVDSTTGAVYTEHGPQLYYSQSAESDLDSVRATAGEGIFVYPSYFWNKNLQDYCDKYVYPQSNSFSFTPYYFRELVVVDDFSMLSTHLVCGRVPQQTGEVLIYDYMAQALITHNVVAGITKIQQLAGVTLKDVNTGVSFTISGVLKSNYSAYGGNADISADVKENYLSTLQTVFASQQTAQLLLTDSNYTSVSSVRVTLPNISEQQVVSLDIKKMMATDITQLTLLYPELQKNTQGVYISRAMAAELLNKQSQQLTYDDVQTLLNSTVTIKAYASTYLPQTSTFSQVQYPIAGVYEQETDNQGVLLYYVDESTDTTISNGDFRSFYMNLSEDWKVNSSVINSFYKEDKSDAFYRDNADYTEEGYAEASAYGIAIRSSDYYLVKVRSLARDIMLIILAVVTVLIIVYTGYTLKKYNYKIAVLKALGANTTHILAIFGTQLLLLGLLAYLVSIPLSFVAMGQINALFVDGVVSGLVFFAVNTGALWLALVFAVFGVLLAASFPLLRTSMASPIKVIRANKKSR